MICPWYCHFSRHIVVAFEGRGLGFSTCLMDDRSESPGLSPCLACCSQRAGSSPPSPVLDLAWCGLVIEGLGSPQPSQLSHTSSESNALPGVKGWG